VLELTASFSPHVLALLACLVASMGTSLGAVWIFFIEAFNRRLEILLLASASGVMLAASFFSLILPALETGSPASWALCSVGILLGSLMIWHIHERVPHKHFAIGAQGPRSKAQDMWLFVFAITLHNFPEGMATTIAFSGGESLQGLAMASGILLQNIPEGLAVAGALRIAGYSKWKSFGISTLSGLVEFGGGIFGLILGMSSVVFLPAILGLAAGAMLFVIIHEILPDTYEDSHHALASFAIIGGVILMMGLHSFLT
jgi:zinc transporter, ZIP family